MLQHVVDLNAIRTEERNRRSEQIDQVSTEELCQIINTEDALVPSIVQKCIPTIAGAIDALAGRVRRDGRIFYIGAGTSGRLGVLDASEIPPTYSAPPEHFVGLIAGGDTALRNAVEGAEDDELAAVADLEAYQLDGDRDSVVGIAASGRTPYVLSGLAFARTHGCLTIGIACSTPSAIAQSNRADFVIEAVTGAEAITGSTRMKAGTATKLILNMISTGVMIKMGKTYGNMMIDVRPTNAKLRQRARRILREVCASRCPTADADIDHILNTCGGSVKLAAVVIWFAENVEEARDRLIQSKGVLADALRPLEVERPWNMLQRNRKYYLCVDGGGSKCSASIAYRDEAGTERFGIYGEAGPCNVTDIGVDGSVLQIQTAVEKAILSHWPAEQTQEIRFTAILIAVAGVDRRGIRDLFLHTLEKRLALAKGGRTTLMNDVELLAHNRFQQLQLHRTPVDNVCVLIAGTGSVGMNFRKEDDEVLQITRSGGWGAVLGDDGSGFDIGRQAIRFALTNLDSRRRQPLRGDEESRSQDQLTNVVLRHFALAKNATSHDLLSQVLQPSPGDVQNSPEIKQRIASVAKAIVETSEHSEQASSIIECAQRSLLLVLKALGNDGTVPENSELVLAGGLMTSAKFRGKFEELLQASGMRFRKITIDVVPGQTGAACLMAVDFDASQCEKQ